MQSLARNASLPKKLGVRKGSVIHESKKLSKTIKIRHRFNLQKMGDFKAALMWNKHPRLK